MSNTRPLLQDWHRTKAVAQNPLDDPDIGGISLRQSEDRFRLALEAAGMFTWQWDMGADDPAWGCNAESLFGSCSITGVCLDFKRIVSPEDYLRCYAAFKSAIYDHSPLQIE